MSNPLLDDLKDEAYSEALSKGNLLPKPREPIERFHSEGYRAAYRYIRCACGAETFSLDAIMHIERGDKGSTKALALHIGSYPNLSFSPDAPKTATLACSKIAYCRECLPALGFSVPQIPEDF